MCHLNPFHTLMPCFWLTSPTTRQYTEWAKVLEIKDVIKKDAMHDRNV
jgi:hypothetical protein